VDSGRFVAVGAPSFVSQLEVVQQGDQRLIVGRGEQAPVVVVANFGSSCLVVATKQRKIAAVVVMVETG